MLKMADSTLPLFQDINLNLQTITRIAITSSNVLVILSHQPLWEDGWCLQMGNAEEAWGLLWSPLPATGSVNTTALSSTPVIIFPATQCYLNIVSKRNRFHSRKIILCGDHEGCPTLLRRRSSCTPEPNSSIRSSLLWQEYNRKKGNLLKDWMQTWEVTHVVLWRTKGPSGLLRRESQRRRESAKLNSCVSKSVIHLKA